jgi:uncharacterized protein YjbJ (UPF0337 family)
MPPKTPSSTPTTTDHHTRPAHAVHHHKGREPDMGLDDKIKNAAQDLTGKAKEKLGNATDNDKLAAEGAADQSEAKMKKAAENVKDELK